MNKGVITMTKKTIEHCVIYKFDEALNFFNTLKKEAGRSVKKCVVLRKEQEDTREYFVVEAFELSNTKQEEPKELEATMVAFTGMVIGTFKAVKTEEGFEVTTAKGKVLVFNSEGIQTNAKNAKFANRLQVA